MVDELQAICSIALLSEEEILDEDLGSSWVGDGASCGW